MQANDVDLKKTVHLPRTDFPMKANLPQNEPKMLAHWESIGLYEKIRASREGRSRYVLHDGPPYANGNIHLGHAFNKILKDFVVKTKSMAGFDAPYIPGWDCHGLPIEIKVDGELGSKKAKMSAADIRGECRAYAAKYVELQKKDFQRLGIFGRWDDPYLTMSAEYEAVIAQAFVDFLDQGYAYKGLKPVNWCLNCRTSLAEAEIEYEQHTSPSIYVRFRLLSDAAEIDAILAGRAVYGLIWTTTPWTIPANLAISFHPKFEYSAVAVGESVYIVASDLVEAVAAACSWPEHETIARFTGAVLEGAQFQHPFLDRESKGILGDHVTLEQGTGAVHTAPGHGQEDYVVGLKYGLPVYNPVDPAGRMFQAGGVAGELPEALLGKTVWQANDVVLDLLGERGALLAHHRYDHSYPHCWRCHKPTIFRATEQWFIGMDRNGLRQRALAEIKKIAWLPAWGDERMTNMVATRPDWNVSRQRVWGVPITVFYCEDCSEPFTDKRFLDRVVQRFREETADAWYRRTPTELLGEEAACTKCGSKHFRKEMDILDVWFDSGASHLAVLEPNGLPWPSDMYLEGGDQYRGWFQSSLLIGTALRGQSPYREIVTSGWMLDGEGRAMSKSLGNVIEPDKVIKQHGADVLRLWCASVEYSDDVRVSELILTRMADAYRKIRNTFRYALGAIDGYTPGETLEGEVPEIDQWILSRLSKLTAATRENYAKYRFHIAFRDLYTFCVDDLSATYFDVVKDRLYTATKAERRHAQATIYSICHLLVRLFAPLLTFTADEVWTYLRRDAEPESVHMTEFPEPAAIQFAKTAEWERLMQVRQSVTKALEVARQEKLIGAPLEAAIHLKTDAELYQLLEAYRAQLPTLFIVSQVTIENHASAELAIEVLRAQGTKCERCWKFRTDIASDPEFATICGACARAVHEWIGG
jgi:isoleucyl-tRNA synthetase